MGREVPYLRLICPELYDALLHVAGVIAHPSFLGEVAAEDMSGVVNAADCVLFLEALLLKGQQVLVLRLD